VKFEDMLIVLLIVVILFGGSKLGQLGAGLGTGLRNFKKAMDGKDEEAPATPPAEVGPRGGDGKDGKESPPDT
jgi:sec-independent protein translocase protein TatA